MNSEAMAPILQCFSGHFLRDPGKEWGMKGFATIVRLGASIMSAPRAGLVREFAER